MALDSLARIERHILRAATGFLLLLAFIANAATAADISIQRGYLFISGKIRRGEAERVVSYMRLADKILTLDVNSPGGDLTEAMRIASLVKGAHLAVRVARGGTCTSACFFLFFAGQPRTADAANKDGTLPSYAGRTALGFVGIHRPYFRSARGKAATPNKQEEMMRQVRSYLSSVGVAQYLIDEMMSRPSNDAYWLTERDLELIGEYSPGDEEALIAECGYKRYAKRQSEQWPEEKVGRLLDCEVNYWLRHYWPAQTQFVAKLDSGWRPWKR